MAIHRTQADGDVSEQFVNRYGLGVQYDSEIGGLVGRKGVGTVERGPTIPKARIPKIRKVEATIPEADIPTADVPSTVKRRYIGTEGTDELTYSQLERVNKARDRVNAYINSRQ